MFVGKVVRLTLCCSLLGLAGCQAMCDARDQLRDRIDRERQAAEDLCNTFKKKVEKEEKKNEKQVTPIDSESLEYDGSDALKGGLSATEISILVETSADVASLGGSAKSASSSSDCSSEQGCLNAACEIKAMCAGIGIDIPDSKGRCSGKAQS